MTYVRKSQDLKDYKSDTNIIIDKRFLKFLHNAKYLEDEDEIPVAPEWYPRCNSYYGYTEDVDALNRVHHLLEAKKYLASFTKLETESPITNPYDEDEAQIEFLKSKPATFLILGKPGIGEQRLGQLLAEYWKCVYIDPEILVKEEIESGSRAGQCIEFNLRCGRAVAVDVILHLLSKRVKSKSAQHRGFVICGFPLIRNDMYQDDPVSSESAVFTAQEIFEEIVEPLKSSQIIRHVSQISEASLSEMEQSEEDTDKLKEGAQVAEETKKIEEAEEKKEQVENILPPKLVPGFPIDIGSATSNIFRITNMGADYSEQLMFVFSLCHNPLIILYITCQNTDVLTKHENYRYNLNTNEVVDLLKSQNENIVYTIFTKSPGFDNEELPDNFLEDLGEPTIGLSSSEMNYLLYLPSDFSGNVATQLKYYRYEALSTIEKRVLLHDPQNYIKLDGRVSPHKMFNIVKSKLRILPIPRVVLPEQVLDAFVPTFGEGDYDINPNAIFEGKTPEECFVNLKERKIINRRFKWKWSKWGAFCPVAMKNGTYIEGNPIHAVKFMNRLFFLSSEEAVTLFLRNPRIYLLPPAPKRSCKIIIIGPKASGKTAVAYCLAIYLSGTVLDPVYLQLEYFESKRKGYLEKVRNEAINVALILLEKSRESEYEKLEAERKLKIEKLLDDQLESVKKRVALEDIMTQESYTLQLTAFPLLSIQKLKIDSQTLLKHKEECETLKQTFLELGLPFFSDVDFCNTCIENPKELNNFLPDELKNPTPPLPPVSIFDDFVTEYADEAVDKVTFENIDLSVEDMLDMYTGAVKDVEERYAEEGEHHGGWIIDGMPPNSELLDAFIEKCKPDDIFLFRALERGFLLNRFKIKGQNQFKDYRNYFEHLGYPEIALKAPSTISTMSYKIRLARDIIDEMLADKHIAADGVEEEEEEEYEDKDEFVDVDYFALHSTRLALQEYDKELDQFEKQCQELINYFEENDISFMEFDVANKTLPQLMTTVIKHINSNICLTAHEFTPEERIQEVEDFGEAPVLGEDVGEEEEEEKPKIKDDVDTFSENRRLGNTNYFCPVSFFDQWVLWRGKEEYAAKYDDKLYFMRNKDALQKFIKSPVDYLSKKPPKSFPPPRICVVGVAGSGKTSVAKYLSKELGLYYASYEDLVKNVFDSTDDLPLTSLMNKFEEYPEATLLEEYLLSDQPLPDEMMDKINLKKLWHDEPIKSNGFVLDDYPKRPTDVNYMRENALIPDVILELSGTDVELNRRRVQLLINEWTETVNKKQAEQDEFNKEIANEWEEQRDLRVAELLEMKKQERFQTKLKERSDPQDEEAGDTDRSQISYDSVAEEADLEEVHKQVALELPEPVFQDNWETLEEATQRIINQTENTYANDNKFFRSLKELCEVELIDWAALNADSTFEKVCLEGLINTDKIKFRNESLFERCYSVSVELAEKLLETGYYFLSRFGRVCPVQVYEKENPVLMFYTLEQNFDLYPILHRSYIYFLAGKVNRDKFRSNPLKYTSQLDFRFPLVPFKVAVIGPPKSGKTALAERFKKEMNLKYISIGQAARYVLRFLPHSLLAQSMEAVLRNGWELTSEMTVSCVAAMAYDAKSVCQGMVFDGFPNSIADVRHLEQIGLVPHLVIDLNATSDDIDMCLESQTGKRGLPVFSKKFIDHRYNEWSLFSEKFRTWLDREYQVLTGLPIKKCKWGVWKSAYELASSVLFEVKHYYKNCDNYIGLRLANMQITPREFLERQGSFKQFCPSCLYYKNLLVSSGNPPDRTGVVQFDKSYYWLCDDHIEEFINNPEAYLSPYNENTLPKDLPIQRSYTEKPEGCYENGMCIVCYVDNRPERVLYEGLCSLACTYKNCIYLFDTPECLNKFLSNPFRYFNKTINFKPSSMLMPLELDELPVLGMLEQRVAKNVVDAVTNTSITRPILPGLSIAQSAALSVGLHLKVNNPNTSKEALIFFKEANRLFKQRRLSLINNLAKMKRHVNPHLHYEEPLLDLVLPTFTEEKAPVTKDNQKGKSRRVPVPDERFDYLCEYFKPASKVPAFLTIVDIAGLVKGASEGQGLGNAFLSHISACDAIFHLCRSFEDEDVTHVEGEVNPVRDLEIIGEELRLKDEEQLTKTLEKLERTVLRGGDKKMKPEYDTLVKIKGVLVDQKQHIRFADWNANDIEILNRYLFLTSKPMIYLVNLAEKDYIKKKNKWLIKIKEWVDKNDPGAIIIPFSGAFEQKLVEIEDPILRKKYCDDHSTTSALDKIIVQGYKALQLEYFFTSGADEVKAWTILKGTKAPQAAGKIHTDFEKGFIMAEVMKFNDFKEEGSETAVKAAGKYRQQGRNYVVEDGDIIFFKFNAGAGLKDAKKK